MMGYTNGHMGQKNTIFRNFESINFLKRLQKSEAWRDRRGNRRQTGAKSLKKY